MIAYIEGTVKLKGINYIIILVAGIGYKVFVPVEIITKYTLNDPISLFTYTYVKEDALDLYGFKTLEDKILFELFLSVSGIGPKTAIAIFGTGTINKIKEAIVKGDIDFFMAVPRLGKKNAQKIIIELRPKLGSLENLDLLQETGDSKDLLEALKSFGFKQTEAKDALKAIRNIEGGTSEKIRAALKYLGKK